MRIRFIIFVPPAALVTGVLFFLTSSIVSAIEQTLGPLPAPHSPPPFAHFVDFEPVSSMVSHGQAGPSGESECGDLRRRARTVAGAALQCITLERNCSATGCEVVEMPLLGPHESEISTGMDSSPGTFFF